MDKLLLAVKMIITALVIILVVQNLAMVEVRFLTWSLSLPMALLLGVIYLLGMVSGRGVIGLIRRLRGRGGKRDPYR